MGRKSKNKTGKTNNMEKQAPSIGVNNEALPEAQTKIAPKKEKSMLRSIVDIVITVVGIYACFMSFAILIERV